MRNFQQASNRRPPDKRGVRYTAALQALPKRIDTLLARIIKKKENLCYPVLGCQILSSF